MVTKSSVTCPYPSLHELSFFGKTEYSLTINDEQSFRSIIEPNGEKTFGIEIGIIDIYGKP